MDFLLFTTYRIKFLFSLLFLIGYNSFVICQDISFEELVDIIEKEKDQNIVENQLNKYIQKAKENRNYYEVYNGYLEIIYLRKGKDFLLYKDSLKWAAYATNDRELIGDALLSIGIQFYYQKNYSQAFNNYTYAGFYINNLNDEYLKNKLNYSLAQVYYVLGFFDESIELFQKSISYFQKENLDGYLNSLHGLASCYLAIGQYQKSLEIVEIGIETGLRTSNNRMKVYFELLQGINNFYKKEYSSAKYLLEISTIEINKNGDFANAQVGYFFLGKIYQFFEEDENSLKNFMKVDSLFAKYSFIRPDLRETFNYLSDYYILRNNPEKSLYYLNQRHLADGIIENMYKNLYPKLFQSSISNKKEEAISNKIKFSELFRWLIILFFGYRLFIYRNKFKNCLNYYRKYFIKSFDGKIVKNEVSSILNNTNVPKESIESLLPRLVKFEKEKKYLEKDWKQADLAVYFKSNVQYVKLLIQLYRQKRFSKYINDLKIDYVVELLNKELKFRKYTNEALAKEGGFASKDKFVKAFKSKMGKNIMDYIAELNINRSKG